MDVGDWLRGLGLERHEAVFRDHAIDMDVLAELTDAKLARIGVPLGDRKRLLKAISGLSRIEPSFSAKEGASPAEANLPSTPAPLAAGRDAERRPVAVMFCDLVGSTNLAMRLDAEDWRNLVNAYLEEASSAVTSFGGHVLKKLGDGLMALFGYPQAEENDAERAVRAALAIHRALGRLNARNIKSGEPELAVRIGIDAGPVVVEAEGEVYGEAPNVAARVQALAEAGAVMVTARVQRQTAGLFVTEDRGAHALKGIAEPTNLFRIVRASGGRRFRARALTPLVGREEELDLLRRRWERAARGEGQLVQIVGEPGIGKSRLVEEFRLRLGAAPHTFVEFSSSQLLQNTPLHPIAEWGRQRFGADAPGEQRLADLKNTLRLIGLVPAEHVSLLAPLVEIPLPEGRAAKLAPEELRRRQLAALTAWIIAGARSQPTVLAFEDLHWADPTTLDLMRALAERGAQAPLFIIATTRPEFRPAWSLRSHHSVVSLSPLDRADVARMVGELAARHTLSKEMVDGVSERTGGVPLFVEEVTRLLLERGEEGGAHAIPPTLQQSLAARLDRLGDAREVAQVGAVLGRDFPYALIRAVGGIDDPALQSALDRLANAGLLLVEHAGHEANYRFKHALIQDAAYDSLLKSRRQALHRGAAEILRDEPEHAGVEPEVIAHHFTEAGLDDLAIEWWGKAGDQALRRSAFQEAIVHLGKAIAMADKADRGKAQSRSGRRPHLHAAYGNALIAARGSTAPETIEAFIRAREAAAGDIDTPGRLAADYGLWGGSYVSGELSAMRAHAETFLGDVEARPDSPEAGAAHRAAGVTHWFAGEYVGAREHLERALALFEPGRDDDLAFRFGQDAGVAAMLYLALTLWPLGDIGRAVSLVRDAEARIAGHPHIGTRAYGKCHLAVIELMRGDLSGTARNTIELAGLTREHDLPMWRAVGVFLEGVARAQSGELIGGLADMHRGLEFLREQNMQIFDGLFMIALADVEARARCVDRAVTILDEAVATSERTGHRAFEAELHRVRGEMLLKRDAANLAPAEEAFQAAIAIARRQATRSFELRAAFSLAKLYQSAGRMADAHAVLAPAVEGFSPAAEPEVTEAQALLAKLEKANEVKADKAQRRRMMQLRVAYGNALIGARGYSAPETVGAFVAARDSALGETAAPERLAADYGLWVHSYVKGHLPSMRTHAATFLRDVEAMPSSSEAGIAQRVLGTTHLFAGEYGKARHCLERALTLFEPGRDDDLALRFGQDAGVAAMLSLAIALWQAGELERAVSLVGGARARMAGLSHARTHAYGIMHGALFELMRGAFSQAAANASELSRLARDSGLDYWRPWGLFLGGLAKSDSGALADGLESMRDGGELIEQFGLVFAPLVRLAIGEAEARAGDCARAISTLNDALALSERTGHRTFDAELHRRRGECLLNTDRSSPAPAEEAFQTAIAVAKQQGARSFGLQATLALAKLYKSTGRRIEAHAVLVPALRGFSPTPEMPEIAEAQALLERLAHDGERRGLAEADPLTTDEAPAGTEKIHCSPADPSRGNRQPTIH